MSWKAASSDIGRHLLALMFVISLFARVGSAQIVINEVLYRVDPANTDPLKTQQWVELFNQGTTPVDLTGWKLSGRGGATGPAARALPATNLAAGGYLVLHFTSGTNSGSDYYTQDTATVLSPDMDEVGLYSPQGIVDFISWYDTALAYLPGTAHNDAVAAGIWTPFAALFSDGIQVLEYERPRPVDPGMSIGRDPLSTDTNATADFEPHGGVGALDNSPNRQNLDTVTVVEVAPPAAATPSAKNARPADAPPNKKWTVMLYFNGDNSLERYIFGNVKEIENSGGSDANINYVLMYDGKRLTQGTQRGLILAASGPLNSFNLQRAPGDPSVQLGERDMADPSELSAFIAWAKTNYLADHYALILSAHGDGWKSWGPDETSQGAYAFDYLYMGELLAAMKQQSFDLIGFDACMMAGIEVLDQLQTYTPYMVVSEEKIPGPGYPYDTFTAALKANPQWTGLDLGKNIVTLYAARYAAQTHWTLSLIDTSYITTLVAQIDSWSVLLRTGAALFQNRDDPTDNVQIRLKFDRAAATQFGDTNFVDLYDLAAHINSDGANPACIKTPIPAILDLISKAVVAQVHSPDFLYVYGMHIYFPRIRSSVPEQNSDYDMPRSRHTDGSSQRAIYAQNHDQFPLKARDRDTKNPLDPTLWPEPPLAFPTQLNFTFFDAPHWSQFLERFYHPVADNHITKGVGPDGKLYPVISSGGGACSNAADSITLPVGSTVYFSAAGSSDADQGDFAAGADVQKTPSFYFWDLDSTQGCNTSPKGCHPTPDELIFPITADNAVTNMDADRDATLTTIDQRDADGLTTTRFCAAPGTLQVTLMVWDNNHLRTYHNTDPTGAYAHMQTDSHQATITCTAVPPPVTTGGGIPVTATLPLSFTVASDPYQSAQYVGLSTGTATATFSGLGTASGPSAHSFAPDATDATPTITITGDRPELVPATGAYNTATNSFDIKGTSTGQIAGSSNVQAEYTLTLGANLTTVTGTYKVGLSYTLNEEPQPVTYNVTGTITNKVYPASLAPLITAVNTSGAGAAIAQNDWIEIHGNNLVPATTPAAGVNWSNAPDFASGHLPTQLSGVSVTVNGKPAFVYFYCSAVTDTSCSSDQVNVLTPLDSTVGPVSVVVTSGTTSSPPFTVTMQAAAPSFLLLNPQGYVAATHANNSLVGPATLYPGYSTPASAGEPLVLYAVGFGLPSTPLVNGSSSQSGVLSTAPVCSMGSLPAPVAFAGLVAPGLYQLNLTVPADAATSEISCTYNGTTTAGGALITIQPALQP